MKTKNHSVYFYFGDYGRTNLTRVARRITDHLNEVFSRTTCRRFLPVGVEKAIEIPVSGAAYKLPEMFAIHCYITRGTTNGGNYLYADNGDAVLTINWPKIDPVSTELLQCITHEVGHAFGCGLGEFYNSRSVADLTGVEPRLKTDATWAKDDYWHSSVKADWLQDPMLIAYPLRPRFSWLNSWIINEGKYRQPLSVPMPDLTHIPIDVDPPWANVTVWRPTPLPAEIVHEAKPAGERFYLQWGTDYPNAVSWDQYRIVKVYPGSSAPFARGLSIWDVQEAFIRHGQNYSIKIGLAQPPL